MKKIILIIGIVFTLLLAAVVILPTIYKEDIQMALDDSMRKNLNANVFYDTEAISVSLIKSFPDLSVGLGNFGIVGVDDFSKDTLLSVREFGVTVDLMSVFNGYQIEINEIVLDKPEISVLVLPDGRANYDIVITEEPVAPEEDELPTQSEPVAVGIHHWSIRDAELRYDDKSLGFYTYLEGLNHSGEGDFTLDIFDLSTSTTIDRLSLGYEGVEYLSNKRLKADITLYMDLPKMEFVFKENKIALNDFTIKADGKIAMPRNDIDMDITFGGENIDLKGILSLIPGIYQDYLAGVTAGGQIDFGGLVKGTYNENTMPHISANLSVSGGSISYDEFDVPIEEIQINSGFDYPSADLSQTSLAVEKFSMLVDGQKIEAYLNFKNLDNYTWDLGIGGNADLEKITKIVPLEGMTLKGMIDANIETSGKMSLVENEEYDKLPTTGQLDVTGFYFQSADLPQGFGIEKAQLILDPTKIALRQFDAKSGNSDFSLQGALNNYMGFALRDEKLLGTLALKSKWVDIDGFLPEDISEEESREDTTALEVVKIPENIDFTFTSNIDKITYTDIELTDFEGRVIVKDGAVRLEKNTFSLLDGTFELSGAYETKDVSEPRYDLGFKIKDLSISGAFNSFTTVQQYVPIAKQVAGRFSSDFKVNGTLGNDMMPLLDKINLAGLVNVAQASLSGGEFFTKLNSLTALKSGANSNQAEQTIAIKDVLIQTAIRDGRLYVEPFDMNVSGQKATLGGSNSLDGKLDYSMLIKEIPTGNIGAALNSAMSSLTGGKNLIADRIDANLGIGGTYDDVKVTLKSTSASGTSTSVSQSFRQELSTKMDQEKAKAEAKIAAEKAKAEAELSRKKAEAKKKADEEAARAKAEADKVRAELEAKKKATQDSIRAASEAAKKKASEQAKDQAKKLFKRN